LIFSSGVFEVWHFSRARKEKPKCSKRTDAIIKTDTMRILLPVCLVIACFILVPGISATDHTVTFQNHCTHPIWVNSIIGPESVFPDGAPNHGAKCTAGQCSGDYCCPASVAPEVKCGNAFSCTAGKPLPDGGGFKLNAFVTGQREDTHIVTVEKGWNVAFWGRTGCSDDDADLKCETGSAVSNKDYTDKLRAGGVGSNYPATKGEIFFDGAGDQHFYDISIVDGYNVPIQIEPVSGTFSSTGRKDSAYDCKAAGGSADLNAHVLAEAPLLAYNRSDKVVGVYSACKYSVVHDGSENAAYCCNTPYGPKRDKNKNNGIFCDPTTWPDNVNSAKLFKSYYALAYSYAYDDEASTFTCKNKNADTSTDYLITFCSGNEGVRITLPGDDTHTHLPVMSPTPLPTPAPVQTPLPAQTPVPSGPYNPARSGDVIF
jgi:hypothetical protein